MSPRLLPTLRRLAAAGLLGSLLTLAAAGSPPAAPPPYEHRAVHDPDGIGKFFLGREIAHVMGHAGADWLERPEREAEEQPDRVVEALKLRPGDTVADLGAGTGYFTWRLARAVGPAGRVLAVDIQPEMLEDLRRSMRERAVTNVVAVLGTERDPRLPEAGVDLVLMVDVYHEFAYPREMLAAIRRALKPAGRVAFVEYRAEDRSIPIKPLHKMTEAQVRREAESAGFRWIETVSGLPRQHLLLFQKPAD